MNKWERLIVYPLLLVALFHAVSHNDRVLEATESVVDEIRARRIVLVDEVGAHKAELGVNEQGDGYLLLYGSGDETITLTTEQGIGGLYLWKESAETVSLRATSEGSGFSIHENGQLKIELSTQGNDSGLILYGPNDVTTMLSTTSKGSHLALGEGPVRTDLLASKEGSAIALFGNKDILTPGMALSATERGGEILVYNSEGSLSADLTSPRGDGEFNLYNVHGNNSVWIRATEKSGEVTLRNPLGGFLAILGQESSGRGGLWIFDKYGLTNKFYGGPHLP